MTYDKFRRIFTTKVATFLLSFSTPLLAFPIATFPAFSNTPPEFPTYFSNILSQTPYPTASTTTRKFQHTFSIYVGISNTNTFFQHTFPTYFLQRKKRCFRTPSRSFSTYSFQPPSAVPIRRCSAGSVPAYSFH